jgi:hypothetical protein
MGMKIEHWHSQAEFPNERLDYWNLLGACMGNEGQPRSRQHCDTRKGESRLSRNPANPAHVIDTVIEFGLDGRISSNDSAFNVELNDVLNLNVPFLKNNRKAVLDAFTDLLGKGAVSVATFERHLRKWNGESDADALQPFCQVVVYWLRRRLSRSR